MCDDIISDTDIKLIYNDFDVKSLDSECVSDNEKSVVFDIIKDDMIINESQIGRTYYKKYDLIKRKYKAKGKVAKHDMFILKEEYRNKGIAKLIHSKEMTIYKKNNFQQIQLEAAFDGILVWKRLRFNYANEKAERNLIIAWKKYAKDILGLNTREIVKVDKIVDISKNKLKPNGKISFTKWYQGLEKSELFKMYKDI